MTKLKNYKISGDDLTFTLTDSSFAIANAIRRTLLSEIKTYAFGKFKVTKNNSPFTDEYITQRISMVPVKQQNIKAKEEEMPMFSFHVKGKHNDIVEFWSDELDKTKKYVTGKDMIVKLKGNETFVEEVHIDFTLEAGIGRQHAKWSPVIIATYAYIPESKEFQFTVENRGFYKTEDLLNIALDTIINKLTMIRSSFNKLTDTTKLKINTLETEFYEIIIEDENHTIGNILSEALMNKVSYIGFIKPHPLEERIVLKIRTNEDVVKIVTNAIDIVITDLTKNKIAAK